MEPLMRLSLSSLFCIFAFASTAIAEGGGSGKKKAPSDPVQTLKACVEKGDIGDATVVEKASNIPSLALNSMMALLKKEQGLCSLPDDCGDLERCINAADNFYEKLGLRKKPSSSDNSNTLKADAKKAVDIYGNATVRKPVSFEDPQSHTTADFYLRTGGAEFNPNSAQTTKLRNSIYRLLKTRNTTQAELIHEALIATEGNLPFAFGSLAKIFHDDRSALIPKVDGMKDDSAKNYYRYAGSFIGLQKAPVRLLGEIGSYGNIAGNPIVYAAAEVIGYWKDTFTGKPTRSVNTIRTVSSTGKVAPKSRQLQMGIEAMLDLTGQDKKTARGFEGKIGKGLKARKASTIRSSVDGTKARGAIKKAGMINFGP